MATSLLKAGYDVTLTGRITKNSKKLNDRDYHTRRDMLLFDKGFLFYAEFNIRLFFYLLFGDFDIYLSNDLDTLTANFLASKIKRKTLVYDSHELFTEVPELVNRKRTKRIWELIEGLFLPKVKLCYTVCDSVADYYNSKYNVNMKVVRNVPMLIKSEGIESILNNLNSANGKKIILYQGSVNIGRGIENVIRAMKYLNNHEFWVVGAGDVFDEMKSLSIEEGVSSKVKFTGRIPFSDLPSITRKASLGISLEENMGLNYYYSLPNKIFDYIHAGVPILVSPFPEMTQIIEKWKVGMVAESTQPERLAAQIEMMLTDEHLNSEWQKNLHIAAKELCWENEEKILMGVFNTIN